MRSRILAALTGLCAALTAGQVMAQGATRGRYHAFTCSNDAVLRVIFDDEKGRATVVRFRQPTIRLQRAETDEGFRYVRGSTHELRGTLAEVRWRVGRSEWVCTAGAR